MQLTGTGIWSRELRFHEDEGAIAEAAAELEELGYSALWLPGSRGGDIFGACERVLDATSRVPVATGIVNVWMHEPAASAAAHARLTSAHPGRFLLGIGISHAALIEQYRRPLATMRDYLDGLDAADPPVPVDERVIAALGPRMLALSAERTAGTHPYLVTPEHSRIAREAVGPGKLVAPEQTVVLETDSAHARERGRGFLAGYLAMPNYTNNLRRLGFGDEDVADGGSDRLVDAVVAWGEPEAIAARVAEHLAAGADHVCIQVAGVARGELPLAQWRALAPML
ncbi:MAG TPA: LLM class F420-dependent oxidoreductase [Solirubrobacteraceae bacterium]|nr:LLM class F420-dependent oxidoreductase [Solirubrobacteraceae bacterium]